jgi:hypothetical protein
MIEMLRSITLFKNGPQDKIKNEAYAKLYKFIELIENLDFEEEPDYEMMATILEETQGLFLAKSQSSTRTEKHCY